jgi:hypothetical protein
MGDILHDLRRLNVAMTRAKHKLIFIGHIPTLKMYGPLNSLIDLLRDDQIYTLSAGANSHLTLKGLERDADCWWFLGILIKLYLQLLADIGHFLILIQMCDQDTSK